VPVTVALPANAAVGDVITVSIDASAPISYTVLASKLTTLSASVLIPTADIVAAGQGGAVVTTTYTDAAGNAASTTTNLTIDTVAPTLDLDGNNSSNATVVSI
jgi:large repetitive protein